MAIGQREQPQQRDRRQRDDQPCAHEVARSKGVGHVTLTGFALP